MARSINLKDKNEIDLQESAELILDKASTAYMKNQSSNFGRFLNAYKVIECFVKIEETPFPYADCLYTIRLNPKMDKNNEMYSKACEDSQFSKDNDSEELVLKTNSELFLRYISSNCSLIKQNYDFSERENLMNTKEYLGQDISSKNKIIINVPQSSEYIKNSIKNPLNPMISQIELSFRYESMSHQVVAKYLKEDGSYIKNFEFFNKDIEESWDNEDRQEDYGFPHNFEDTRKFWLEQMLSHKPSYKII